MTFRYKRWATLLNFLVLLALLINFGATGVFAGVNPTTATQQNMEELPFPSDSNTTAVQPSGGFAWGSFTVTVVIFIVVLGGLSIFVKRLNQTPALTSPWLKVLDKQQLGPGHFLYLVEIAGRLQILGVTGQNMVKIVDIDDVELAGEILQDITWRSEQVLPPWWAQLISQIKVGKFAQELRRNRRGGGEW